MVYEEYEITLSNGSIVHALEESKSMADAGSLVINYADAKDNDLISLDDKFFGPTYVLKKNIVCIRLIDAKKVEEEGGN